MPLTSFDVNAAVAAWKAEISPRDEMRKQDLVELESHLRESIADLQSLGLSDAEAFLVARRRVGGREVAAELAAAHPDALWINRCRWVFAGILAAHLLNAAMLVGSRFASTLAAWISGDAATVRWAQTAMAGVSIGICAWLFYKLVRGDLAARIASVFRRFQSPLGLAGLCVVLLLAEIVIPQFLTVLQVRLISLDQFAKLTVSGHLIDLGVFVTTTLFLVVALHFSHRRAMARTQ
jgi:hypothetical protein